jgi:hypothetical protein
MFNVGHYKLRDVSSALPGLNNVGGHRKDEQKYEWGPNPRCETACKRDTHDDVEAVDAEVHTRESLPCGP